MSVCGEIENLEHEIRQAVMNLESLHRRKTELLGKDSFQSFDTVTPISFNHMNRIEVIDATGRRFVDYDQYKTINLHIQDGGKTMKLFLQRQTNN